VAGHAGGTRGLCPCALALASDGGYLGLPTSRYVVQYASDLTTGPWLSLVTNTPDAYGIGSVQDTTVNAPRRFFRSSEP